MSVSFSRLNQKSGLAGILFRRNVSDPTSERLELDATDIFYQSCSLLLQNLSQTTIQSDTSSTTPQAKHQYLLIPFLHSEIECKAK